MAGQSLRRKHCACAGVLLGGHVRAVFTVVLVIFLICVAITLTSFREIPLDVLTAPGIRVSKGGLTAVPDQQNFGNLFQN
jgi:hypothetical protein